MSVAGEGILPCVWGMRPLRGRGTLRHGASPGRFRRSALASNFFGCRGGDEVHLEPAIVRLPGGDGWPSFSPRASPRRSMGAAERDAHLIHHQMNVAAGSARCATRPAICAAPAL